MPMNNLFVTEPMRILEIRDETPDVRTFVLQFRDERRRETFAFRPGQFGEFSVLGAGEAAFGLASSPARTGRLEISFRRVGKVTTALWDLTPGDDVGFRGPYGNSFPVDEFAGRNMLFIGGGIAMSAIRATIEWVFDHRDRYGDVLILNGARTVADMVYKDLCRQWATLPGVRVVRTVDRGGETPDWDGEVGMVPSVLERLSPSPANTAVVMCGPPVMIRFALASLEKLGFPPETVYTTLENRMKCGFGKCGRCNVGPYYVCKDGPVFTAAQLAQLPRDY
jgi:sulfhydrogenase subunit gamma (sulfur reductase)